MGKVAWGPCGSGELVTCGNHAYAMWRAEGAEHEAQPIRNLVNAMRWPALTEGTSLASRQPLRHKASAATATPPLEQPVAAARRLSTIAEAAPSPLVREAALTGTSTLRSSALAITPSLTPSTRWPPGSVPLSAAMLQSPVGPGPAVGAAVAAVLATPAAVDGSSQAQAMLGPRSGNGSDPAAAANRTPLLQDTTPVGTTGPVSTAAATDATDDDGPLGIQADKPSQHGLENLFMSLSSPGRIERPAR